MYAEIVNSNSFSHSSQHSDEWTDVLTGSMAQTSKTPAEGDLEEYRSNECVYYLRTYGNHSALISFYVRHSCWMKAARYILENVSDSFFCICSTILLKILRTKKNPINMLKL